MEQPFNNASKYDLENIIKDIFNGIKPSLNFSEFLELISVESEYSVCWRPFELDETTKLYLFFNEWNMRNKLEDPQNYITKYFNNLVLDSDYNIVMYGGPKVFDSNRDKITLSDIQKFIKEEDKEINIYKSYEGTSVNVFYYRDRWYFSTKRLFDMNESKFGSKKSHGSMFEEIISREELTEKLDKSKSYHFVIVHNENTHLSEIKYKKLILIGVRDKLNMIDTSQYINEFKNENIILSPEMKIQLTELNMNIDDNESQGYIIHYNNLIFRVYNEEYGKKLDNNPKFNSIQEAYIWNYKNNKLTEETDNKIKTIGALNFVSILLHRTLVHFTKFKKYFTEDELKQYPTYKFIKVNNNNYHFLNGHNALIKSLSKLQHYSLSNSNILDVDYLMVKNFVKKYCSHQDIYGMYKTFLDNQILWNLVRYKKLNNDSYQNILDFQNII